MVKAKKETKIKYAYVLDKQYKCGNQYVIKTANTVIDKYNNEIWLTKIIVTQIGLTREMIKLAINSAIKAKCRLLVGLKNKAPYQQDKDLKRRTVDELYRMLQKC